MDCSCSDLVNNDAAIAVGYLNNGTAVAGTGLTIMLQLQWGRLTMVLQLQGLG
jgi:hypothetical protein